MPTSFAHIIAAVLLCASLPGAAAAHTSLGEYVQHRYAMAVSSKNIDLTVELTFNGNPANSERALMDTDKNGVISRGEQRAYVSQWEKPGIDPIRLLCAKVNLPVTLLYMPELDLQDDRGLGQHPFTVRLKYFARTPEDLAPDAPLRIESSLQLGAPALVKLDVSGDAAAPISIEPGHGDTLPALTSGSRSFEFHCPKFKSAAGRVAGGESKTKETSLQSNVIPPNSEHNHAINRGTAP